MSNLFKNYDKDERVRVIIKDLGEVMEGGNLMYKIEEIQDPSIPEMKSKTYGIIREGEEEPNVYISINFQEDFPDQEYKVELAVWTPEDGTLYIKELEA